ncbi:MAG TPA: hypothetical protein VGD50_06270 [Candidatus Baltobacteraceae bacterium]
MPYTLIERTLGSLDTYPVGERRTEEVVIESDALGKRLLRVSTSVGDLGIRLADAALHDADIVYADDNVVLYVAIAADDVLLATPASVAQAIDIAHALGNRHLPIQRSGDAIVLRYDPLVEQLFVERNVAYVRERRRLREPFRHAHAPHGHE